MGKWPLPLAPLFLALPIGIYYAIVGDIFSGLLMGIVVWIVLFGLEFLFLIPDVQRK